MHFSTGVRAFTYTSLPLRHSQPLPALLPSRQCSDLHRQSTDVLLVAHHQLLHLNGGIDAVVVRAPVVGAGGLDESCLGLAGQVTRGVSDDPRLFAALLELALALTAHGHDDDFHLKHTGGRLDFQFALRRVDRRPRGRPHG